MWDFIERRRSKRLKVEWNALLNCVFPGCEENLETKVLETSLTGAKLALERLQIGSYHLVVGNSDPKFKLTIPLQEGSFVSPVAIRWYNWSDEERCFSVGVEYICPEEENRKLLARAVNGM